MDSDQQQRGRACATRCTLCLTVISRALRPFVTSPHKHRRVFPANCHAKDDTSCQYDPGSADLQAVRPTTIWRIYMGLMSPSRSCPIFPNLPCWLWLPSLRAAQLLVPPTVSLSESFLATGCFQDATKKQVPNKATSHQTDAGLKLNVFWQQRCRLIRVWTLTRQVQFKP